MSDTEWVPGNWDDVEIGQNVCLRNDDGAEVEINIVMRSDLDYPGDKWVRSATCRYTDLEWSLLVEAAPLPTEAGWYLTKEDTAVYLAADGYWTTPASFGVTGESMTHHAPFNRLEPVKDMRARVLPSLKEVARCIAQSPSIKSDVSTVDLRGARRVLANLITELEAHK